MSRRPSLRSLLASALLVAALVYGLFVFHPGSSSAEVPFDGTAPDESYAANMSLTVDGEQFVAYRIRNDRANGSVYLAADFEKVNYTTYWRDNRSITRSVATTDDQFVRVLHISSGERLVRRDNETRTAVVVDADEPPPGGGQELLLTALEYPRYERAGTTTVDGRNVSIYAARSGWYRESASAYVSSASGVIYVATDSDQLLFANVTYDFVEADTWGDYAFKTYVLGEQTTSAIRVRYDPGPTAVTKPQWVRELPASG